MYYHFLLANKANRSIDRAIYNHSIDYIETITKINIIVVT